MIDARRRRQAPSASEWDVRRVWRARTTRLRFVLVLIAGVASPIAPSLLAQTVEDMDWYDASTGKLSPPGSSATSPPTPSLEDPASPHDWTWKPPDFSSGRNWNFSGFGEGLARVIQVCTWILLIALGIWFIFFLIKWLKEPSVLGVGSSDRRELEKKIDIAKMADLPFDSPAASGDLLSVIRQKAAEGKFGEAIVLLFGYKLLRLDKAQMIRILKGKTNRQYVREIRRSPRLSKLLSRTMVAFEDYFFGKKEISSARFEDCFGNVDEFEALIKEPT